MCLGANGCGCQAGTACTDPPASAPRDQWAARVGPQLGPSDKMGRWAPADCPLRHLPSPSLSRCLRADQHRQRCVINGAAGSRGEGASARTAHGREVGRRRAAGFVLARGGGPTRGSQWTSSGQWLQVWGHTLAAGVHGALQYPGHLCVVQKRKGWGYVYGRCAQMCYQGVRGPTCTVIMGLRDSS